jgi:hypothetical protein
MTGGGNMARHMNARRIPEIASQQYRFSRQYASGFLTRRGKNAGECFFPQTLTVF